MGMRGSINNASKLIAFLKSKDIYIFGAGYVANLFWEGLMKNNLCDKAQAVILTHESEMKDFHGLPILAIDEYNISKNDLICIAVHESILDEIEKKLEAFGIVEYVWVAPYVTDLIMGDAVTDERFLDTLEFPAISGNQLGIAIRCGVIDQYYGKNLIGYDLYKRSIAIFSNENTAKARLEFFINLIRSVEEEGLHDETITVDDKYEIIDGEHRFSLAFYHGAKKIKCRIYKRTTYHRDTVKMSEDVLRTNGFSDSEILFLKELNKMIKGRLI